MLFRSRWFDGNSEARASPRECRNSFSLHRKTQRIFKLGIESSSTRRRTRSRVTADFVGHASAAQTLAKEVVISHSRLADIPFSLSLCISARASGRRTGVDLLLLPIDSDVPYQGKNLRTAEQEGQAVGLAYRVRFHSKPSKH